MGGLPAAIEPARDSQGQLAAVRGSQGQPGTARGSQEQPGAIDQGQPGTARGTRGKSSHSVTVLCAHKHSRPWGPAWGLDTTKHAKSTLCARLCTMT